MQGGKTGEVSFAAVRSVGFAGLGLQEKRGKVLPEVVTAHCLWSEMVKAVCVNVFHMSST